MKSMDVGSDRENVDQAIEEVQQYIDNLKEVVGENGWEYKKKKSIVESGHKLSIKKGMRQAIQ